MAIPTGAAAKGVASAGTTGVNMFSDPLAVFNEFRRPLLGQDTDFGRCGCHPRIPVLEPDATISKDIKFSPEGRIGATLLFQFVNILNHFVPNDPTTNIDTASSFGVVTNQFTTPNGAQNRSIEFGLRVRFRNASFEGTVRRPLLYSRPDFDLSNRTAPAR